MSASGVTKVEQNTNAVAEPCESLRVVLAKRVVASVSLEANDSAAEICVKQRHQHVSWHETVEAFEFPKLEIPIRASRRYFPTKCLFGKVSKASDSVIII